MELQYFFLAAIGGIIGSVLANKFSNKK